MRNKVRRAYASSSRIQKNWLRSLAFEIAATTLADQLASISDWCGGEPLCVSKPRKYRFRGDGHTNIKRFCDTSLARTLDIIATTPNPWVPAFNRVRNEVAACANCCKHKSKSRCQLAETDRRLNQVAWLALLSLDPLLMYDAAVRTKQVLAPILVIPPSIQIHRGLVGSS